MKFQNISIHGSKVMLCISFGQSHLADTLPGMCCSCACSLEVPRPGTSGACLRHVFSFGGGEDINTFWLREALCPEL